MRIHVADTVQTSVETAQQQQLERSVQYMAAAVAVARVHCVERVRR